MSLNIKRASGDIFIFISCIPWVGLSSLDSQPFPILAASVFLGVMGIRSLKIYFPLILRWIAFLLTLGLISGLIRGFELDFTIARAVVMYMAVPIYISAYMLYFLKFHIPINILILTNIIWLMVGVAQLFIPDIVGAIVSSRTTLDRGVTSLAPEPTFFGVYLFFVSWIYFIVTDYRPQARLLVLVAINFIAVVLLAMSSMVLVYIILSACFVFLYKSFKFKAKHFIIISLLLALVLLAFSFVLDGYLEETRLSRFVSFLMDNPWLFFEIDASANSRLAGIVLPLHGFFTNIFLPGGLFSYPKMTEYLVSSFYGNFFFYDYSNPKINSWLGALLFELGIFGFIVFGILLVKSFEFRLIRILELTFLVVVLLTAIPIAFPFIPFIFAIFILRKRSADSFKPLFYEKA